jgi:hypothetical protein
MMLYEILLSRLVNKAQRHTLDRHWHIMALPCDRPRKESIFLPYRPLNGCGHPWWQLVIAVTTLGFRNGLRYATLNMLLLHQEIMHQGASFVK